MTTEDKEKYYQILKSELESPNLYGYVKDNLKNKQGCFVEVWNDRVQKILSIIEYVKKNPEKYKEHYEKWAREQNEKIEVETDIKTDEIKKVIVEFYDKRDLAKKVLEKQPFYYDESRLWWFWDKELTCWKLTDETNILNVIGDISLANTISSKDKIEILEALRQEARKKKPKPIKESWIQFKGEIIDIKTGDIFEATPEYFTVNPIPWELDKDCFEDTPNMDKIFGEWVGEENIKTLYEILAYSMIPSYPIHRIFCFIGAGLNGKSCFLNLLRKFIGIDNICSTELDALLNSRFEKTRLHKKLACIMGETNFNEIKQTSMLKKLTGQDLIGFEYKNKNLFDEINYAKILIATNNLPETNDKTIGFYRRWMIIDFPNQFSEKTDILATIPDEEYKSLALKCCSILNDLLKKREFTNEGSIEERTKRYEDKSNPMAKFIKEFCDTKNPNGYIFTFEFEKKFNEWCRENRYRTFSDNSIAKKLNELGMEKGRKQTDFLIAGETKFLRCWFGIEWKENKTKVITNLSNLTSYS